MTEPVFVVPRLTVIDTAWALIALADECIGERTCNVCAAAPGQPCRPELHGRGAARFDRRAVREGGALLYSAVTEATGLVGDAGELPEEEK